MGRIILIAAGAPCHQVNSKQNENNRLPVDSINLDQISAYIAVFQMIVCCTFVTHFPWASSRQSFIKDQPDDISFRGAFLFIPFVEPIYQG